MINVEKMKFNNFIEFMEKRRELRIYYIFLSQEEKREYKKYIYNTTYKEYFKDKLWEYLNEPYGSPYYVCESEMACYARYYARGKNYFELFF